MSGDIEFDGQDSHTCGPGSGLKVPAKHAKHISPLCPENPALHMQAFLFVLFSSDWELLGQFWHTSGLFAPLIDEYFPCTQETQLVSELAASAVEYFPCTQLTQESIDIAPTVIEYVPVLQFSQLILPGIYLNVPATHAIHTFSDKDCAGENPALHVQFV